MACEEHKAVVQELENINLKLDDFKDETRADIKNLEKANFKRIEEMTAIRIAIEKIATANQNTYTLIDDMNTKVNSLSESFNKKAFGVINNVLFILLVVTLVALGVKELGSLDFLKLFLK